MTKRHRIDNPEDLSDADLLAKVKADNDAAEQALIEKSQGQFLPGPGHDVQKMLAYLRRLCVEMGVLEEAELDYEAIRAEQIGKAEQVMERMRTQILTPPPGLTVVGDK